MGDCHYLDGNVKAEKMFNLTQELIKILGIDPERVRLEWISSAEGTRFAEVATEFTEKIRSLGPASLKKAA
jgi:F420-non-reducing hydrogenase iron-sulfur subunit